MISFLEGTLSESWPTRAVINCQGIGYEVLIPVTTYDRLPKPNEKVRLLTHLVVREDAHTLYGFFTPGERDLFRLLLHHVSGVGPKTALSILAGTTPQSVRDAVATGDITSLAKLKGLGKKTAERIVLELRDKLPALDSLAGGTSPGHPATAPMAGNSQDALLALLALGYKSAEAQKALSGLDTSLPSGDLVRDALRRLG
ncbi:MAG: Holliday junction branch migration protein RuvA [Verrucomicrobia bacterium]|nr:Holliday junction branch migration protein RuvA [Verrucomicrobiota bacterium]